MGIKAEWHLLKDEQLLGLRFCDLPLRIDGTPLAARVARLHAELAERGLRFKPHVWLSEEWFSPDGVPGFAIPFYLAHPRLVKLERKQMLEVEGGTERECLRIMRHEAGHALSNAFRLHARRRWQQHFGPFARPYPDSYKPRPDSRDFVLHLNAWYAQAHPAEDFAETFAVWLGAGARWRRRYQGWGALTKLEYVDELMGEIKGVAPGNRRRDEVEPLREITKTLGEHYRHKRQYYAVERPAYYDRDLRRVFADEPGPGARPAAAFLRRHRRELRHVVAEATGVHHYTVDHLLKNLIDRSKGLKLGVLGSEAATKQQVVALLAVHTMNFVHQGYHRIAL